MNEHEEKVREDDVMDLSDHLVGPAVAGLVGGSAGYVGDLVIGGDGVIGAACGFGGGALVYTLRFNIAVVGGCLSSKILDLTDTVRKHYDQGGK